MKYFISILCISLIYINTHSQQKNINLDSAFSSTNRKIERIDLQNENNSVRIEGLSDNLHHSNESISNQISSSTNYITIWGYIFGLFGIALSLYVTWIQNRTANLLNQSRQILLDQQNIQKEVIGTRNLIESDLSGLYRKLQDEEIKYLIQRLSEIPEDIDNTFNTLATVNLTEKFFPEFKAVVINAFNNEQLIIEKKEKFMVQCIQHFPKETIFDSDLKNVFVRKASFDCLSYLFETELNKFLSAYLDFINERGITTNYDLTEKVIISLLQYEGDSRFDSSTAQIAEGLLSQERRELFYSLIKDNKRLEPFVNRFVELYPSVIDSNN